MEPEDQEVEWPQGFDPEVIPVYEGGDFIRDMYELDKKDPPVAEYAGGDFYG